SAPETLLSKSRTVTPPESSVVLLRTLLANSSEKVTIIQVGFSTNLAALLVSEPDRVSPLPGADLIRDKVALVSVMAGNFAAGPPEYNVKLDIPSAREVFEHWPTPIVFSGFEIGRDLLYPSRNIDRDFTYVAWHPIAFSHRAYHTMPYDRPTWDLTAALQAIRPDRSYFALSEKGRVRVSEDGMTTFEAGSGDRQYVRLESAKRAEILEALTLLASEPPR
ncbi:MAG: nucleoside hydrolase, partial [Bryobacteraceae bacterium]